jgi:zinc transport system permease protein
MGTTLTELCNVTTRLKMLEEALSFGFLQRALIGGALVVIMLSVLSFFVVLRRISFIGVGVSHSALGGVALGVALGVNITAATSVFCVAVAVLIGFLSRRGGVKEDAAIGIIFSGTMALGVTLIAISGSFISSLFAYLFGSILSVTRADIYVIVAYCALVVALIGIFFKPLLYASFDEEVARVAGVPTSLMHYMLVVLTSLAIVASMKLVGIVLVSAMLVLPAATANQLAGTYSKVLVLSMVSGIISLVSGLALSYRFDLPSGATIVLCACAQFFVCFALSPAHRRGPIEGG